MKGLRGSGWKSSGKNSSDKMGCTLAPVGAWGKGKGICVKRGICKDRSASKGARGKKEGRKWPYPALDKRSALIYKMYITQRV